MYDKSYVLDLKNNGQNKVRQKFMFDIPPITAGLTKQKLDLL